jgi:hypothetical protein
MELLGTSGFFSIRHPFSVALGTSETISGPTATRPVESEWKDGERKT